MLWIIQNNLYNEDGYVKFINALDRLGSQYLTVKPVPFTNIILPADFDSMTQNVDDTPEPEIDTSQKIVVMGATSLVRIAKAKGWTPGSFLNENFTYEKWKAGFGPENILNPESIVCKFSDGLPDLSQFDGDLFVRPVEDNKAFTGVVMSQYDFHDWFLSIAHTKEVDFQPLHENTEIAIASCKQIYAEYRFFVVRGIPVTGSMYKRGNQVHYEECFDANIFQFVNHVIGCFQGLQMNVRSPSDAFVVDIAETPDGYKVIEMNNLNSAGFYACDPQKIISSIEELVTYHL